jgi:hypothetical protein
MSKGFCSIYPVYTDNIVGAVIWDSSDHYHRVIIEKSLLPTPEWNLLSDMFIRQLYHCIEYEQLQPWTIECWEYVRRIFTTGLIISKPIEV